jgi:hypothetical protein
MARTKNGSGGKKKYHRNLVKCAAYRASGRRERNKLRRIARNNGPAAVAAYKAAHGLR